MYKRDWCSERRFFFCIKEAHFAQHFTKDSFHSQDVHALFIAQNGGTWYYIFKI